ncbi:hypothetical protein WDJ51_06445 [Rathayibacter sp. YIM 133350]|uniref:hypothetical protein n=1 Tax=Rathayibacter sp. YIM 133350 TaxID=3131992 RepID=UPI00307ECC84
MTNSQLEGELERLAAENALLRIQWQQTEERLSAENDRLQRERDEAIQLAATQPIEPLAQAAAVRVRQARTSRWWTVLSVACILIGLILAPVALVGSWAKTQLTDTDAFVATFAPLAEDPAVQAFISDQVVAAIDEQVDIPALTDAVFDGIEQLGLPPRAADALNLLRQPATAGLQSLVSRIVNDIVTSDAFADIWSQALRVSHDQLMLTMQGDENAAVSIGANGEIGVQLGPIIAEVKQRLVDRGIAFAANIPAVDKTVVIAKSDTTTLVQVAYAISVAVGTWLPWVTLAFLVVGVLAARRRIRGLLGASIGLGLVMIAVASGIAIGKVVFVALTAKSVLPADAAGVIYSQLTAFIASSAVAVAVLAITVAVVTWLAGPYRAPRALRSLFTSWFARARRTADAHGVTTGRFGRWLYAQRVVVRVVVVIAAAAVVLFVRPLSAPLIIWTAVLAIVVLGISELLQRPASEALADPSPDTPSIVA